jgi:hypothetical protein
LNHLVKAAGGSLGAFPAASGAGTSSARQTDAPSAMSSHRVTARPKGCGEPGVNL